MVSYRATPSVPCVCTVRQSRCAMRGPSPPARSWAIRPPTNPNQTRAHENAVFGCMRLGWACLCQAANQQEIPPWHERWGFAGQMSWKKLNKELFLPQANAAKLLLGSHLSALCDFSVALLYMILAEGRGSGQWEKGTQPWATTLPWWRGSSVVGGFITLVRPPVANRS